MPESELALKLEQANVDLHRAQWRIAELEADLSRTGQDHARTASALRSTTAECERLRARVAELEERQRAIDGGHTHLPPAPRTAGSRPSWEAVHVEEVDDQATPRQGSPRPR